jgi:hypothetical protein
MELIQNVPVQAPTDNEMSKLLGARYAMLTSNKMGQLQKKSIIYRTLKSSRQRCVPSRTIEFKRSIYMICQNVWSMNEAQ